MFICLYAQVLVSLSWIGVKTCKRIRPRSYSKAGNGSLQKFRGRCHTSTIAAASTLLIDVVEAGDVLAAIEPLHSP